MITLIVVLISLLVLVKSADVFVDQASSLAKKLKVNDFIIGFTVVAFGTSLPELVSTVFSAIDGHNQLVMSNVIGSNITNLCLIFGIIAVFNDYKIRRRDIDINIPINFAAMMVFWAFSAWSGFVLNWAFGISLILIFLILILLSKDYNHFSHVSNRVYATFRPWLLIGSLILLVFSGKICIEETILLAKQLKIAETILGYFILSIGTSLPELVTTWIAVKRKDGELGVGNILGSNLFNLLFALGVSSFIRPVVVTGFRTDLLFLTMATLAVYVFAILGKKYSFSRREGAGLLFIYLLFVVFQVIRVN
ncbi:sodium:calcium antiporter [Candidatus Shapirobacteria bacterium]|nr:sodium:calcium antiporter [Candidatus Shapirobacteria bacterium]